MNVIEVEDLAYSHGRVAALRNVSLRVPKGALYALLGPNGSGKTTLLQCLMGLRKPKSGRATVLGADSRSLSTSVRTRIGYVAEGQHLPAGMKLREVEAYLAPFYEKRWDHSLANELRERFGLDASRRIRTFSRGEQMKAAMLCALAPRPELLIMDEPFTGMDAIVKNDLVSGLLDSANSEGASILLCSHDIGELELLADHVGILDAGELRLSATTDDLRERFKFVDVTRAGREPRSAERIPSHWMSVQSAGNRLACVIDSKSTSIAEDVASAIPDVADVEVRDATLREILIAVVQQNRASKLSTHTTEIAA